MGILADTINDDPNSILATAVKTKFRVELGFFYSSSFQYFQRVLGSKATCLAIPATDFSSGWDSLLTHSYKNFTCLLSLLLC